MVAAAALTSSAQLAADAQPTPEQAYRFRYVLASALYGTFPLADILPEVAKTGADAIDIWCLPHGDQREQIDKMGVDAFAELLQKHNVKLGVFTRYPLGPFKLGDELKLARKLGGKMVLCGSGGPKDLAGAEAAREIRVFLEKMKPHIAAAEELGVTIAIENHGSSLLSHPDSLRAFADQNRSAAIGVAFAPHHLHAWADQIPQLIEDLGRQIVFFYAQEHGRGSKVKLPKEQELMQLPGFGGGLDYKPVAAALRKIRFAGPVEIFMHPVPRGVPILPTIPEITAAVNKSRAYLDACLAG
jgi:sugar phosphate isomerase/epimerase